MTKRIANRLSIEQAELKVLTKLKEMGYTVKPIMSTYIDYNSKCDVYCELCDYKYTMKFNLLYERGKECTCFKKKKQEVLKKTREEKARIKKESNIKTVLTPQQRWEANNYTERLAKVIPTLIPDVSTFIYKDQTMKMFCTRCESTIDKRIGDSLKGSDCGNCYGVGFNKNLISELYILSIEYEGIHLGYKIGITNKKALHRTKEIQKESQLTVRVIYSYSDIGSKCQEIERKIKALIPKGGYISKELMKSGHTETFNPIYINQVLSILFQST